MASELRGGWAGKETEGEGRAAGETDHVSKHMDFSSEGQLGLGEWTCSSLHTECAPESCLEKRHDAAGRQPPTKNPAVFIL